MFEGLYKPDSDGNLVPAVASGYEVSDDGLVYTFTLRDGVKFHNGNPVTAADVKSSLETCADSSSGSALIPAFSNITSIETPDDKTVVITLAEADADFLSYVAGVKAAIVPADNADPDADPSEPDHTNMFPVPYRKTSNWRALRITGGQAGYR